MTKQDMEWVKAIVHAAVCNLATELPKNCPMLRRARFWAIGVVFGVTLAGMGSPLIGRLLENLWHMK